MKRIILILAMVSFLCPVSLFAQQTVPLDQSLQMQLDAIFWEINYCRQRTVVLQTKSKQIQEQIQLLRIEKQKKILEEKEEADK